MNLTTLQINHALASMFADWKPNGGSVYPLAHRVPVTASAGQAFGAVRADAMQRSTWGTAVKSLGSLTGPGASPGRSETSATSLTYQCNKYRIEERVPDEIAREANGVFLNAVEMAGRRLTSILERDLDSLVIRQLLVKANWGSGSYATLTTGASGTSWLSHASANSDPLANIRAARDWVTKTTGYQPDTIAMTADVFDVLADHPQVGGVLKYTTPGAVIDRGPAELKGLRLRPIDGIYDTTPTGSDPTPAYEFRDTTVPASCAIVMATQAPIHPVTYYDGIAPTQGGHGINRRVYRDDTAGAYVVDTEVYADMVLTALDNSSKILGAYAIWSVIV